MKKSGVRTSGSAELIVAPQAHQVAAEVLAQRDHLGLEAAAQLEHERLVDRLGLREHGATADPPEGAAADPARYDRLDRGLREVGERPVADGGGVHRLLELLG